MSSAALRSAVARRVRALAGQQQLTTRQNAVLLTFDDGPHPTVTPAVLALLRAHGARAVFFVVGSRIPKAPHLLKEILDQGHLLGNHTFDHPLDRQYGVRRYRTDVAKCQDAIGSTAGVRPRLFRPALGHVSLASIAVPRMLGLKPILWSADSNDWRLRSEEQAVAAADVLLRAFPPDGVRDIVLMHDDNAWSPRMLELVLAGLSARGIDLTSGVQDI